MFDINSILIIFICHPFNFLSCPQHIFPELAPMKDQNTKACCKLTHPYFSLSFPSLFPFPLCYYLTFCRSFSLPFHSVLFLGFFPLCYSLTFCCSFSLPFHSVLFLVFFPLCYSLTFCCSFSYLLSFHSVLFLGFFPLCYSLTFCCSFSLPFHS